jgi:hypothetical protein
MKRLPGIIDTDTVVRYLAFGDARLYVFKAQQLQAS